MFTSQISEYICIYNIYKYYIYNIYICNIYIYICNETMLAHNNKLTCNVKISYIKIIN